MRETKFRLISPTNEIVGYEKWYSGCLDSKNFWEAHPCWLYSKDNKNWNPKPITHRFKDQYTGLKDKNGVEIFKGDIVKLLPNMASNVFQENKNVVAEIKYWNAGWWYFTNVDSKGMLYEYCREILNDKKENKVEIIGNIHSNPELLKKVTP